MDWHCVTTTACMYISGIQVEDEGSFGICWKYAHYFAFLDDKEKKHYGEMQYLCWEWRVTFFVSVFRKCAHSEVSLVLLLFLQYCLCIIFYIRVYFG